MTDTNEAILALADAMFAAIEQGDLEALRALYADDLVVWANFDDREQDVDRSLKILGWLVSKLTDRHYDVKRREVIPGGFIQEHVLRGTAPDGTAIAMPACIVATVADGRVARIHEYLDPAGVAALANAPAETMTTHQPVEEPTMAGFTSRDTAGRDSSGQLTTDTVRPDATAPIAGSQLPAAEPDKAGFTSRDATGRDSSGQMTANTGHDEALPADRPV